MSLQSLDAEPGTVVAEKYEVASLVDRNPLGAIYRAVRQADSRECLLLLLDPEHSGREHKDMLIDRFKALRGLGAKRECQPLEIGSDGSVAFVAFDHPQTTTLRELMDARQQADEPFTLREAAQITIQVLDVAGQLHGIGTVARAIRPEYLYVSLKTVGPKGGNVVVDTKFMGGPLWDLVPPGTLAEDEYNRGSGQYIAPELKGIDPHPTPRSDVFSAGAIFYELLCGEAPTGTYQLPKSRRPELPREVDTVTELALSVAPEDRYPTAHDFAAGIQRTFIASDEEGEAGGVSWVVWALGVAIVGAVSFLVWNQTRIDPMAAAIEKDNLLRKEIFEAHARPTEDEVRDILAKHPPNMRYIPGGPYLTGRLEQEFVRNPGIVDEPAAIAELDGYLIDIFEHPNLQNAPPTHGITWKKAKELCEVESKRLCTAEELEKSCRGPENYVYGYGDTWDPMFCGEGVEDIHPSGRMGECKSNWGVYDIAGNFREWTSTMKGDKRAMVLGGIPNAPELGTRCSFNTDLSVAFTEDAISFRCCRDVDAEPYDAEAVAQAKAEYEAKQAKND